MLGLRGLGGILYVLIEFLFALGNLVANCDSQSLSCHCYWPVVSDFINVLSHQKVVESFMLDKELISQWFSFVLFLSGKRSFKVTGFSNVKKNKYDHYTIMYLPFFFKFTNYTKFLHRLLKQQKMKTIMKLILLKMLTYM